MTSTGDGFDGLGLTTPTNYDCYDELDWQSHQALMDLMHFVVMSIKLLRT